MADHVRKYFTSRDEFPNRSHTRNAKDEREARHVRHVAMKLLLKAVLVISVNVLLEITNNSDLSLANDSQPSILETKYWKP